MPDFRFTTDGVGARFVFEDSAALAIVRVGDVLTVNEDESEVKSIQIGGDDSVVMVELRDGRTVYKDHSGQIKSGLRNAKVTLQLEESDEMPDRLANTLRGREDILSTYVYMWFRVPPAISPIEEPDTKFVYQESDKDKSLNVYRWQGHLFSWRGTNDRGIGKLHDSIGELKKYVKKETEGEAVTCPKDGLDLLESKELRKQLVAQSI